MKATKLKYSFTEIINCHGEKIILFIILSVAFWLRFRNLGNLGLYGDEDFTYLAVKGILENGYPVMPSGMIYPRGVIFSYLSAMSASLFGLTEFSLRLTNVFFSLLVIYMIYILAKNIFGYHVALVSILLYSLSAWDIEMTRFARMYEIFLFFFLLSVLFFYRGFLEGKKIYRIFTPLLFLLTMTIHGLGLFLITLFVCPFFIKNYRVISRGRLLLYGAFTVIVDYTYGLFENSFYDQAMTQAVIADNTMNHGDASPDLTFIFSYLSSDLSGNLLVLIIMSLVVYYIFRIKKTIISQTVSISEIIIAGLFIMAALFRQFGLAFWIFSYYLFTRHQGFRGLRERMCINHLVFLVISFIAWFGFLNYYEIMQVPNEGALFISKRVLLSLIDYPFLNIRVLYYVFPLMTIIVLCASLLLFDKSSKEKGTDGYIIVLIGFYGPLLATGFFKEWIYLQYVFMIYPFFIMAYVWFIYEVSSRLLSRVFKRGKLTEKHVDKAIILFSFVIAIALSNYHSFTVAKSVSDRTYSSDIKDLEIFEYTRHPDYKSTAMHIKNNMESQDIIIAIDNLMTFIYAGKADYLLRTEGVGAKGLQLKYDYIDGTPVIRELHALKKIISTRGEKKVWLITSPELMGPHLKKGIMSDDILLFLKKNNKRVVYTGYDGITQVFLWDT